MTEPGAEALTRLFARAEDEADPLSPPRLDEIVARGRQRRRRRAVLTATSATIAVVAAIGLVRLATAGLGSAPSGDTRAVATLVPGSTVPGGSAAPGSSGADHGDGLLETADLGSGGWVRGTDRNDQGAAAGGEQPGCRQGSAATSHQISGTGRQQTFRGSTPQGAEWLLLQQVVTLSPDERSTVAGLLKGTAATGCTAAIGGTSGDLILAASDSVLVTGVLLPEGSVGYAHAYALAGSTWISLETLPGGAIGQIPLPGQTRWLLDVTGKAAERATGRPLRSLPAPNAAAERAAAAYRTPTNVVHVPSGGPVIVTATGGASGDPTAAPGAATPPRGFLHLRDLGSVGGWTVNTDHPGDAADWRPSATTEVVLPSCSGATTSVSGPGGALIYRGSTAGGSGEWILNETVVHLGAAAPTARAALAAAATCPHVGGGLGSGTPVRASGATSTTLVLGYPLPDGRTGYAQAWTLKGDVLVQLDTLPGGAAGGAPLPGGVAWLQNILLTAGARGLAA